MRATPDDAELRAIEQRLAAAFPLPDAPALSEVPLTSAVARRPKLTAAIAALMVLDAALAAVAVGLLVVPREARPPERPSWEAAAREPTSSALLRDLSVSYSAPGFLFSGQVAPPMRRTRDLTVASRAVAFEVLLPRNTLGEHLDYIEIPPTDSSSTGPWGALIHYGNVYMSEFPSSSEASAAEEVRQEPMGLLFNPRWDHWVDVNGHRAFANSAAFESTPVPQTGDRHMPSARVVWNDGRFVYRLDSMTLTYEQLLVIARSVPAR